MDFTLVCLEFEQKEVRHGRLYMGKQCYFNLHYLQHALHKGAIMVFRAYRDNFSRFSDHADDEVPLRVTGRGMRGRNERHELHGPLFFDLPSHGDYSCLLPPSVCFEWIHWRFPSVRGPGGSTTNSKEKQILGYMGGRVTTNMY